MFVRLIHVTVRSYSLFFSLHSIPLYEHTSTYLSILLFVHVWVVSSFWLSQVMLLQTHLMVYIVVIYRKWSLS